MRRPKTPSEVRKCRLQDLLRVFLAKANAGPGIYRLTFLFLLGPVGSSKKNRVTPRRCEKANLIKDETENQNFASISVDSFFSKIRRHVSKRRNSWAVKFNDGIEASFQSIEFLKTTGFSDNDDEFTLSHVSFLWKAAAWFFKRWVYFINDVHRMHDEFSHIKSRRRIIIFPHYEYSLNHLLMR